jgi:EAL domain-containing protein (putative c-di-GMP-specific phosphodiesterase class I)
MPAAFIAIAEESGEITAIGRWVLHEACRQASVWQHAHAMPDLRVNVNLSARQFTDPGLTAMVASALRDSGLPPRCLTLGDHREHPDGPDPRHDRARPRDPEHGRPDLDR